MVSLIVERDFHFIRDERLGCTFVFIIIIHYSMDSKYERVHDRESSRGKVRRVVFESPLIIKIEPVEIFFGAQIGNFDS